MERRQFFKNIGNLGALSASAATLGLLSEKAHADQAAAYGGARGEALNGPYLDLSKGPDNKIAYSRMNGDLDESKQKYGWFKGYIMALRPNKPIIDCVGIEGFGVSRLEQQADGS